MCEGLMLLPLGDALSKLTPGDWVDIGCAVVALVSIGMGAARGLAAELPLGVGWFCGILAAWYAYSPTHTLFQGLSFMQGQPEFLLILTLITIVLLAWGVSALVSRGLNLLAAQVEKKPADHVLGFLLGVVRAFLLLLVMTAIMLWQTCWLTGRDVFCDESRTGRAFTPWASDLLGKLRELKPHIEIHRRTDDPGDLSERPTPPSKPPR